eukprot:m.460807 g.460807  ORF g.460807 m.460807 type:complete len:51 (+) comp229269_c0_seq1:66-218(+)
MRQCMFCVTDSSVESGQGGITTLNTERLLFTCSPHLLTAHQHFFISPTSL